MAGLNLTCRLALVQVKQGLKNGKPHYTRFVDSMDLEALRLADHVFALVQSEAKV